MGRACLIASLLAVFREREVLFLKPRLNLFAIWELLYTDFEINLFFLAIAPFLRSILARTSTSTTNKRNL